MPFLGGHFHWILEVLAKETSQKKKNDIQNQREEVKFSLDIRSKRMKLDRYRIQHITIKMNQDIKEVKTMKLLGENTGGNLRDTGFDSDFSGYDTQKAQAR